MMEQVCPGMPAPQLDRLVVEMARVEIRHRPQSNTSLEDQYFVPRRHN